MNLFKEKNTNTNNLLSATKPKTILKTGYETQSKLQTRLKQKSRIKIFIEENRYFVEHSAAYALGLIKTRAIMLENPKLVEISSEIHEKLKANDNIEIEYIKMEKKQPLKVYMDGSNYAIDSSAAYALGLLSVEEFNSPQNEYYYITEEMIKKLNEKYRIEFYAFHLEKNQQKKNYKMTFKNFCIIN